MVKIPSTVHTRVENAIALRKEILETALKATELLQEFKLYKKDNTEKNKLIAQFKKEISDLRETVHELEFKDLPKEITPKVEPEVKPAKEIEEEIKEEIEKPIVKSEMEQEIEDLRAKIEAIKI